MTKKAPFSRSTRLEKSIAALEAELVGKRIPPINIADEFIDTTDASNFEERLSQLSPELRQLIEGTAKDNVLAFDSIIEECIERSGYPGGWTALRDWARRQPWHGEAVELMKPIMDRLANPYVETEAEREAREKAAEELEAFFQSVAREEREREGKK